MIIRLFVTDDHDLVRAALEQFLGMSQDIKVVGMAGNCEELLQKLHVATVDVLLLDLIMPGRCGVDLVGYIRSLYPDLKILVLSMQDEASVVMRAMKAGASGYLTKNCSPQDLLAAIRKVASTGKYLSPQMAEQLAFLSASPDTDDIELLLSERERSVLGLIVKGKSVGEIANELSISDKTVSTHKNHLLKKLGLRNAAELVRYALQHNLAL